MRLIALHLIILLVILAVDCKGQDRRSDTISVRLTMCETVQGDTVMFKSPPSYHALHKFVNRQLRYPAAVNSVEPTLCRLYFIIDTTGQVKDAWCAPGISTPFVKEVTRVARRLGPFIPSYIKGRPVATQVETRFLFYDLNEDAKELEKRLGVEIDFFSGVMMHVR